MLTLFYTVREPTKKTINDEIKLEAVPSNEEFGESKWISLDIT